MIRVALFTSAFVLAALAGVLSAKAEAVAHISLSEQKMTVVVDGVERHTWPVSTARRGKRTPVGTFRPQTLVRMHYSSLCNNAPCRGSRHHRILDQRPRHRGSEKSRTVRRCCMSARKSRARLCISGSGRAAKISGSKAGPSMCISRLKGSGQLFRFRDVDAMAVWCIRAQLIAKGSAS